MSENLEEKILHFARHGLAKELSTVLEDYPSVNLDCQGKNKSNRSWTPLHLAAYFGHKEAVEVLLNNKADPDIVNHTGDTALHKAALTSREDVVMCLLQHGASTSIINEEGKKANQVASDVQITNIIEAAERKETSKRRDDLMTAVKEGRHQLVKDILAGCTISVNSEDDLGNTALHHAVMRDQRAMVALLLHCGADPAINNASGDKPVDLCDSKQMQRLLEVKPIRNNFNCAKRFEGPLMKRKRFLRSRWHWVVLERGVMSFFVRRADAAIGLRRRSYKYLTESTTDVDGDNTYGFIIRFFDGSHYKLQVHPERNPTIHRQKWLEAIREHASYSNHFVVSDHTVIDDDEDDVISLIDVKNVVQTAQVHHQVLKKQLEELTSLVDRLSSSQSGDALPGLVVGKCNKLVSTSSEMSESFAQCIDVLEQNNEAQELRLKEERERNRVLEQALQALATEHHNLEQTISSHGGATLINPAEELPKQAKALPLESPERRTSESSTPTTPCSVTFLSDEDEFYDAVSGESEDDTDEMSLEEAGYEAVDRNGVMAASASTSSQMSQMSVQPPEVNGGAPSGGHRSSLPVAMFSRDEFSIWHILRQCIGKELSKITMPVIFNEPLSFIQRLCEYMEYSVLIEKACAAQDSLDRMQYVAAFAVSALASQMDRLGKPFNPLLGETYEYKRDDLGFHWVAEQVSHHPPVSAFHARGTNLQYPFVMEGSIYPKLKFWGKSVEVEPRGTVTLHLPFHDESYTWTNPKMSIHNIVVGKLWMEQHGIIEITNHKTNERCMVTFKPYSWFRNDINKIEGSIYDTSKQEVRFLVGDWTKYVYSMSPDVRSEFIALTTGQDLSSGKSSKRKSRKRSQSVANDDINDVLASLGDDKDCKCLWKVQERPAISSKMFNMTQFAMSLNEEKVDGYELSPTDTRLRPDVRQLENGDIDGASEQKHRLEEKQRTARKLRHKKKSEWSPRWFIKKTNPTTKVEEWTFNQQYLTRDWSKCPDIF